MLSSVKQEQHLDDLRFENAACDSLSSLLRSNDMIAVQNLALAPPHMGPPHPREILDGKLCSLVEVAYPNLVVARGHPGT
jgi:hypothetical protein